MARTRLLWMLFVALGLAGVAGPLVSQEQGPAGRALQLNLEGAIGAATADFITGGIRQAEEEAADLVIIRMDTPGGLDSSMRDIISAILNADVPVATYVSPAGARADSAGTYILYASHIAAMAPTTHLGAATPVPLAGGGGGDRPQPPLPGGQPLPTDGADGGSGETPQADQSAEQAAEDGDAGGKGPAESEDSGQAPPDQSGDAMSRKILNDAVAYIRGLAERRGRNAEWAEKAVRDAATLTSSEALEMNVIDLLASDTADLLAQIDGREVELPRGTVTLATGNMRIETVEPTWRQKLLSVIASPEIALLLLLVGIYGLIFEGWNPGAIVPGVVGAICLLLAAYALQVMPVNYAGLGLILLGIVLMIAEIFVPSFGALGFGGIAAFVMGAIMMFDTGVPGFGISPWFVIIVVGVFGLLLMWVIAYLLRLRRKGAVSGQEQILKEIAVAREDFADQGEVMLEGEIWTARTGEPVKKGQKLRVERIDGLVLDVSPAENEPATD
ncbi:NfeD family protein [Lentisalinibacter salinarum]|uniref:NfeD family protein n=1 Tax=Lentisalinibacter salinarum TaxID=2992239 RepID=UPI00386480C1